MRLFSWRTDRSWHLQSFDCHIAFAIPLDCHNVFAYLQCHWTVTPLMYLQSHWIVIMYLDCHNVFAIPLDSAVGLSNAFAISLDFHNVFIIPLDCHNVFAVPLGCHNVFTIPLDCHHAFVIPSDCRNVFAIPLDCHDVFAIPLDCHNVLAILLDYNTVFAILLDCHNVFAIPLDCPIIFAIPFEVTRQFRGASTSSGGRVAFKTYEISSKSPIDLFSLPSPNTERGQWGMPSAEQFRIRRAVPLLSTCTYSSLFQIIALSLYCVLKLSEQPPQTYCTRPTSTI